jgi:tRNA pseudouridine55 synthase
VGHAGTLDPLATGLLLVLVGRGTRLQPFLTGLDKRYTATVRFGVGTDSLDRDGVVTATAPVPPSPASLDSALAAQTGEILQEPPLLSALKQAGRSLHHRARAGEDVAPPAPRPVRIDRLVARAVRWGEAPAGGVVPGTGAARKPAESLLPADGRLYEVDLEVACGSGTYVRAIARDLGRALGTEAHVQALRREAVGPFTVDAAASLDDLLAADDPAGRLRPLAACVPHAVSVTLDDARAAAVRQGAQPERTWFAGPVPTLFRLLDSGDELVAVGRYDPQSHQPRTAAVFGSETAARGPGAGGRHAAED